MGGLSNLGLKFVSKKLSGNQDLSLFVIFVVFSPSTPFWFHYLCVIIHLHIPLLVLHGIRLMFQLVFGLPFLVAHLNKPIFFLSVKMEYHKYFMPLISWKWETLNSFKFSSFIPCEWKGLPIWACKSCQKCYVVTKTISYYSILLSFYEALPCGFFPPPCC
jgi:hypothetical protein